MELRTILDIAHKAHEIHKQHHQLAVAVEQESDDLGVSLQIDLQAVIPAGALLLGRIKGLWLGRLSAADPGIFRDADGNFLAIGPIHAQRGRLYIPYGAACNRGAGLYTLVLSVVLYAADGTSSELGNAEYKFALPPQRPWDRVEFLRPLLRLCMAVIRVDDEILRSEVRGLKALLITSCGLRDEDMPQLRAVMKDPEHGDLRQMLASIFLRLPTLTPLDLVEFLCQVAHFDGPINAHELSVIQQIAQHLELKPPEYKALLTAPPPALSKRPA